MKQLSFFLANMEKQEEFEAIVGGAVLYCGATATVGDCVLREIKARGSSIMGAKAFAAMLLSASDVLRCYAERVAEGQGLSNGAALRVVGGGE